MIIYVTHRAETLLGAGTLIADEDVAHRGAVRGAVWGTLAPCPIMTPSNHRSSITQRPRRTSQAQEDQRLNTGWSPYSDTWSKACLWCWCRCSSASLVSISPARAASAEAGDGAAAPACPRIERTGRRRLVRQASMLLPYSRPGRLTYLSGSSPRPAPPPSPSSRSRLPSRTGLRAGVAPQPVDAGEQVGQLVRRLQEDALHAALAPGRGAARCRRRSGEPPAPWTSAGRSGRPEGTRCRPSGIFVSSTITSGIVVATAISASRPLRAGRTAYPTLEEYRVTASPASASSSTMRTEPVSSLPVIGMRFGCGPGLSFDSEPPSAGYLTGRGGACQTRRWRWGGGPLATEHVTKPVDLGWRAAPIAVVADLPTGAPMSSMTWPTWGT